MHFQQRRRFTNLKPSDNQIAFCRALGVRVTGDMSRDEVMRTISQTQARLIKTLLQAANIREGSIVEYCSPANDRLQMCVVTRFHERSTWVRFLEGTGKRHHFCTVNFDVDPPTLNYRLVYTGSREWTHSLSVLPLHASEMRTDRLRERTDALLRYIGERLVFSDHVRVHEAYGEYWATSEVVRLKALFEQEFPEV